MDIDWDENKRRANIDKHQVDIVEAALIFENWVLTIADERFDYGDNVIDRSATWVIPVMS